MDVSIPAASNNDFNQWAMVLDVTALCGFMVAINSLGSPFLRDSVLISYVLRVVTGHNLPGNEGEKNSDRGLPCLDCFARLLGRKTTPSSLYCLLVIYSCARSADLDGCVRANNMDVFHVKRFNDISSFFPRPPESPALSAHSIC